MPKQAKTILQTFPMLINTEVQTQKRRYSVPRRDINCFYSCKLKEVFITSAIHYSADQPEASLMLIRKGLKAQVRIKKLLAASDLKIVKFKSCRIGVELNNAKVQCALDYLGKGYTVMNNMPSPKNKQLAKKVQAMA